MPGRAANGSREFGPLEGEVMGTVWKAGRPVSVREIVGELNARRAEPLAYTTVMTVMNRLAEKEALVRSPAGRSFIYGGTVTDSPGIAGMTGSHAYGEWDVAHARD